VTEIWHNPRCSKSRETLALLKAQGVEPAIRLYLETPPDAAELRAVLDRLGLPSRELLRLKEARAAGIDPEAGDEALIAAMAASPSLIERPVVIAGDRAALGRPPEAVLKVLDQRGGP